ncbi:tyrosine-type recombinase/integrase [Cellvibrio polysaccharolyticus]|uniref:Tyr recombinase domain-containing protein n=1 Tax=Cellvibrio polysaccharolyticus TaxID=2082724 RepID=A0A928V3B3_9GAMM|nr:tyrosine-type recombinase/integrase [Cellvibrio polysaccharolyticus]MBE8717502.1 hypothetical protein [Cellvibrio polysaccharolyticus]
MSRKIIANSKLDNDILVDRRLVQLTGVVDGVNQYNILSSLEMLNEYFALWYPDVDLDKMFPLPKSGIPTDAEFETPLPSDGGMSLSANWEQAKIAYMVSQVAVALNGSQGRFRTKSPDLCTIEANDDKCAMEAWIKSAGARSIHTARAYRKEAERFQWWAQIEAVKPLSGLTVEDVGIYENFLADPVSRHTGKAWYDDSMNDSNTGKRLGGKYATRTSQDWYPFDGPLKPEAANFTMTVLKSMYRFWVDVGYIERSPLALRKSSASKQSDEHQTDRALSQGTWQFVHHYIESLDDRIPLNTTPRKRLELLRSANQRLMIFRALYLLGVRISELATIKMSDFVIRPISDGTDAYWVSIQGRGNRTRTIPATRELIEVSTAYRHTLNTFPVVRRGARRDKYGETNLLPLRPSKDDNSTLILSSSGTAAVSSSRLAGIVKETLAEVLDLYRRMEKEGNPPVGVNPDQLEKASAHWMRHTSAIHQSLDGMSLQHLKKILGHVKLESTLIYSNNNDSDDALVKKREDWISESLFFRTDDEQPNDD